jgi:hypothetical protein
MKRSRFLLRALAGSVYVLFFGPRSAEAADDEDFTMSSGPLLGGANSTGGA